MKKTGLRVFASIVLAGVLTVSMAVSAFASQAVITSDGTRIRSEASTNGSVVTTGAIGSSYEIVETVSAADGYTWYKIKINDTNTGYVRGDLVKVKETESAENTTANTASSNAPTTPQAITETTATIAGDSAVNIRSGAGKEYSQVTSLPAGTSITLIGQANDSAGNKWYQLRCDSKNVEGYIRSDLLTISQEPQVIEEGAEGEGAEAEGEGEVTEEPEVEEPVEPEPENNDYEIVYTTDADGVYQYYLYDHINNTRQEVVKLIDAVNTLQEDKLANEQTISNLKLITIICGALAVIFMILMVLFIIKSRNAGEVEYYEDDFEDEEEEEPEEDVEQLRRHREQAPSRSSSSRGVNVQPAPQRAPQEPRRERSVRPESAPKPATKRRTPSFLSDDDEFEFEFLNMDDKD